MSALHAAAEQPALLLLDLNGVLVFEHGPALAVAAGDPAPAYRSLDVPQGLRSTGRRAHPRSRAEARRILQVAELDAGILAGVMVAEDLAIPPCVTARCEGCSARASARA